MSVPTALVVLREQGPVDLRDLTAALSRAQGGWSLLYDDVDAWMRRFENEGRAVGEHDDTDFRRTVWRAT